MWPGFSLLELRSFAMEVSDYVIGTTLKMVFLTNDTHFKQEAFGP